MVQSKILLNQFYINNFKILFLTSFLFTFQHYYAASIQKPDLTVFSTSICHDALLQLKNADNLFYAAFTKIRSGDAYPNSNDLSNVLCTKNVKRELHWKKVTFMDTMIYAADGVGGSNGDCLFASVATALNSVSDFTDKSYTVGGLRRIVAAHIAGVKQITESEEEQLLNHEDITTLGSLLDEFSWDESSFKTYFTVYKALQQSNWLDKWNPANLENDEYTLTGLVRLPVDSIQTETLRLLVYNYSLSGNCNQSYGGMVFEDKILMSQAAFNSLSIKDTLKNKVNHITLPTATQKDKAKALMVQLSIPGDVNWGDDTAVGILSKHLKLNILIIDFVRNQFYQHTGNYHAEWPTIILYYYEGLHFQVVGIPDNSRKFTTDFDASQLKLFFHHNEIPIKIRRSFDEKTI